MKELKRNTKQAQSIIDSYNYYYNYCGRIIHNVSDIYQIYYKPSQAKIEALQNIIDNKPVNSILVFGGFNCDMYTVYEYNNIFGYYKKYTNYNTYLIQERNI